MQTPKTTTTVSSNEKPKEKEDEIVYEFSYTRANRYTSLRDVPTWTPVKRPVPNPDKISLTPSQTIPPTALYHQATT